MPSMYPIRTSIYPLPTAYRKPIEFMTGGKAIRIKGGRALVLDLLIDAGSNGIDRSATLRWVANISDTICALRSRGIVIQTCKWQPANYVLRSEVLRIEAET